MDPFGFPVNGNNMKDPRHQVKTCDLLSITSDTPWYTSMGTLRDYPHPSSSSFASKNVIHNAGTSSRFDAVNVQQVLTPGMVGPSQPQTDAGSYVDTAPGNVSRCFQSGGSSYMQVRIHISLSIHIIVTDQ